MNMPLEDDVDDPERAEECPCGELMWWCHACQAWICSECESTPDEHPPH